MADGHRIHRVIGRESEGVTRTQAEEFIEKVRSEAREGRLSLPRGRKTQLSFAEASKKYIDRLEESNGKNLVAKRRQLRLYLTPFFGSQRLDSISTFTVDRYKKRRLDKGASNGTVNLELATLSHLFNFAIEWEWLKSPPCKIRLLAKTQGRIVALTDEQENGLLRAAIADDDPHCWLFVVFGLNTAMRHQEILRARFEWLDLEKRRLFIPRAKGGRREQPITPELAELLRREREDRTDKLGWIFPSPRPTTSLTGHRDRMDKPVSEGRDLRRPRSQDRDAPRHAAHCDYEARAIRRRFTNNSEHQRTQDACDGATLHARSRKPYRQGDCGYRS
jgi:integrase